jgi:superfamily II DNA/RNA helicase/very-short-patch-repair endonuclease
MNVFELRDRVIDDYASFVNGFIKIRDDDIKFRVKQELDNGLLWPDPLIQLSPNFESGGSIDDLIAQGLLHQQCSKIFRRNKVTDEGQITSGMQLQLHHHQTSAIRKALENRNYILTTGTGSGKSLSYIIPIVDHVLKTGSGQGIKAIIVYPMNALANSQKIELEKFLTKNDNEKSDVTFERYTGQEGPDEKNKIIENPPDILLTNFVMLELILTRGGQESEIIKRAKHLRFLVLDELHTYRGRQGADVAMLVRRTRNASQANNMLCVGTSATLASSGTQEEQKIMIAEVGRNLFGVTVEPSDVVCERLQRITNEIDFTIKKNKDKLKENIETINSVNKIDFDQLKESVFASWIESTFGVRSENKTGILLRQNPISAKVAHKKLNELINIELNPGISAIQKMLMLGHNCTNPHTGRPTFAFRLHQFISRGDTIYTSLEPNNKRHYTFIKQKFIPDGKEDKRLYPLVFCRHCGHEFYSVLKKRIAGSSTFEFLARDLLELTIGTEETEIGFLYGGDCPWPDESATEEIEKRIPEEWKDQTGHLLKNRQKELPEHVYLSPLGNSTTDDKGISMIFMNSPLRFCPCCGVSYSFRHSNKKGRDFGKVSALGTEGRSSATTILTLSAVRHARETDLPEKAQKILSFTDNRQDASLQAGHFNDFIKVSLLRGALYAAVKSAGSDGLRHSELISKVFDALNLEFNEYSSSPFELKGNARQQTDKALREVLGYRLYCDLERGWRITAPNLEQTGLLEFDYESLTDLAKDQECWYERQERYWSNEKKDQLQKTFVHSALSQATPQTRETILRDLLAWIRSELAIKVDSLNQRNQEGIFSRSRNLLIPPWGFDETDRDTLIHASVMYPRPKGNRENVYSKFLSASGGFGDYLCRPTTFPEYTEQINRIGAAHIINDLFSGLIRYGILEPVEIGRRRGEINHEMPGFQLVAERMIWRTGNGERAARDPIRQPSEATKGQMLNEFFRDYYQQIALLTRNFRAHEHTAQVLYQDREKREEEFRKGTLPVLFCSPTMELGIDISELNLVNMRNVPPTPANYAQRSGRAGRSGQPALVLTYCSTGSQHDQYFFKQREQMVAGVVAIPQIDLQNEELIRSHIHAIWLSESGLNLGTSLVDVIDLGSHGNIDGLERVTDEPSMKLQQNIIEKLHDESIYRRVRHRTEQIFDTIRSELQNAPWYTLEWIDETLQKIPREFEDATCRWKNAYISALRQLYQQNKIMGDASRNSTDKAQAENLHREAYSQLRVLLDKDNKTFNDYYSYRYFATEGFLPGYNFPRLPLTAYIQGERGKNHYLSRPRFLAISEFGPRAVIYHEGATYIINKVTLPLCEEGEDLITQSAKICKKCGYLHPPDDHGKHVHQNNCDRCNAELDTELTDLLRLQNVSTKRRTRINCDEEERLRYGYDIQTTIRFAQSGGRILCQTSTILCEGEKFGELIYGDSATIWRINFGYRRQREEQRNGFLLDCERGYWGTNRIVADTIDDPDDPMSKRCRFVKPYVSDNKNCLLLDMTKHLNETEFVTLQAALRTGIRHHFELEESELAAEVLPNNKDRRMILFYESAEGGAGILRQIVQPHNFKKVIKSALESSHFDPDTGEDNELQKEKDRCDTGCYNCLLSYSNQFDHEKINRKSIQNLLLQLRDAVLELSPTNIPRSEHLLQLKEKCESELERSWLDFLEKNNLALPTVAQYYIEECHTRSDFAYIERPFKCLIYIDGPPHDYPERQRLDKRQENSLKDFGWEVIRFHHQDDWHKIVKQYVQLFGDGK